MFGAMDTAPVTTPSPARIVPRWQWSRLQDLAPAHVYAVLAVRQQVFTVEQHCAFQDADGLDMAAWHLLGWSPDDATPSLITYLRVLDPGAKYSQPSIGRVLTAPSFRGCGLGRAVMLEGLARCAAAWPGHAIRIAAQRRLERFYSSLGFGSVTAVYIEDGIEHVDMVRAA